MQVEEIALSDPGQDGPAWTWTGPGFSAQGGEQIRQKAAQTLLDLQRKFCVSGDPVHALTAWTWCQLYRTWTPPWVEVTVVPLAWSAIMAPVTIHGRRRRQVHWLRYAAVRDHLRQQWAAGVKKPNKRQAYRDVSKALRGQLGRGAWTRIEASFHLVDKAVRRGEVSQFAVGVLDNRFRVDAFGDERGPPPPEPPVLEDVIKYGDSKTGWPQNFGGDRSAALSWVISWLMRRGKSDEEIEKIILDPDNRIGDYCRDHPEGAERNARHQIKQARALQPKPSGPGSSNGDADLEAHINHRSPGNGGGGLE